MERIAIIDHDEHRLYIEDIPESVLNEQYDGEEEKYIEDMYDLENYSWDFITEADYIPVSSSGDFFKIDFNTIGD